MKNLFKALLFLTTASLWAGNVLADPVWIDVRTEGEYTADHIEGDANIPLATIDPVQLATQFGKDAEINLYCRSGGRAGQAKEILEAAGFTNITNVGGIDDVRDLRDIAMSSSAQ
jgi:phage shock protein E